MYLYPVSEFKLLTGREAVVQVAGGEVAGEADEVGDAAPGLEADEGAAGLIGGPEAEGFGLVAADRDVGALVLVEQRHALHGAVLQHEGVDGEGLAGDGQEAFRGYRHGHRGVQFREVAAVQPMGEHGLHHYLARSVEALQVAVHRIRLVVVRQQDRRMGADLEVDVARVGVQHFPFSVEASSLSSITHRQLKLIRILLERASGQHIPLTVEDELRIPREAVLPHRVLLAVHAEGTAVHLPHHGKQDGRPPAPILRVPVPEVFVAVTFQALELSSMQ